MASIFSKARQMAPRFGRTVFQAYERRPLLMNTATGGVVYTAGELIGAEGGIKNAEWDRIGKIGLLGCVEGGVICTVWYNFLGRFVGLGVTTGVVLIKCSLDQIFFSTQQNALFLALCAYQSSNKLDAAVAEVKATLYTTWLNDCSMWPIVNFVGFAYVPNKLIPAFMASMQLIWQIYLSGISGGSDEGLTDAELTHAFRRLDTDHSGTLEASELASYMASLGFTVSKAEIEAMIADADKATSSPPDGKVSLEEFLWIARNGSTLNSAALWEHVLFSHGGEKGSRAALKRLDQLDDAKIMKVFNHIDADGNGYIASQELRAFLVEHKIDISEPLLTKMLSDAKAYARERGHRATHDQERLSSYEFLILFKHFQRTELSTSKIWLEIAQDAVDAALDEKMTVQQLQARREAEEKVKIGGAALVTIALVRKFVGKV